MSALASIKTSGWRASPLSSQWKPSGLLSQASQSSVEAGNVVSGKADVAPSSPVTQPTDGQTSPLVTKPMEAGSSAETAKDVAEPSSSYTAALKSAEMAGYPVQEEDTPVGKIATSYHWDGGAGAQYAKDGRILRKQQQESLDGSQILTVGYELEEPTPKPGKEYGLNTDKKVHRIEVFDANGKSKGYTYRLADERSLFKGFAQDFLATPIAAPLMGMAGAALAPGIASATGLSAAASNVAASGLIGGVTGAASGAGFGKGAVMGAVGGAINNYNPAGQMGVSSGWQAPVNNAIKAGVSAGIKGDSIKDAVVGTVLNPVNLLKLPGWRSAETQA